jgi:STE24 endopeptidase
VGCLLRRFLLVQAGALLGLSGLLSPGMGPREVSSSGKLEFIVSAQPSQSEPSGVGQPSENASSQTNTAEYTLSHDRYVKAVAYSRAGYTLYFVSVFVVCLCLFLLLQLGIVAKLRGVAENFSDKGWVQGLVFVPLLLLLVDLADLPVSIYWHSLSLRYEQSVQRWGSWFWDWTKAELLQVTFGILLAMILFALMRWSPRRWWIYFWFPAVLILIGIVLISPLVIDPWFNTFEPLDQHHPSLVASIEKLTRRSGDPVPPERMFLMLASKKTNAINAYVTGLGGSKRVVIWDTTVQKTSEEETLYIVGHELGHYVLGHVKTGLLFGAGGILLALFLLHRMLHAFLDRWSRKWKISSQEDWASLAVLLLLLQVLLFVAAPIVNGFSRVQEHAADLYGLEVIHGLIPHSNEVAAHAFQRLGELDLSDPNPPPIVTFWLYSHPPLAERLVFVHNYDPWSKGETPKYVK